MRTGWIGSGGCVGLDWMEWRDDKVGIIRRGMLVWWRGEGMGVWGYGGIVACGCMDMEVCLAGL